MLSVSQGLLLYPGGLYTLPHGPCLDLVQHGSWLLQSHQKKLLLLSAETVLSKVKLGTDCAITFARFYWLEASYQFSHIQEEKIIQSYEALGFILEFCLS